MGEYNYIDIGIVVLILLSAIVGFIRGFVREAFSLATWVAAIVTAFLFFQKLALQLPFNIPNDLARLGVAFLLIFLGVLLLGSIINYLFNKAIHAIGLGGLDRILGGAFGVVRGALVVTLVVLLMGLGLTTFIDHPLWKGSELVPHFVKTATWIKKEIPSDVSEKIKEAAKTMGLDSADTSSNKEAATTENTESRVLQ